MISTQTKHAFLIVWLILSAIFFAIFIAPFFLSSEEIYQLTPTCEWRNKYNKECFFCGMTTAFIHISQGNFLEANASNQLSIPFFSMLFFNEIIFLIYLAHRVRGKFLKRTVNKELIMNKPVKA